MTDLIRRLRSQEAVDGTPHEIEVLTDEAADALESANSRIAEFERILDGLPHDAVAGGWTARGSSAYAKKLETRIAELEADLAFQKSVTDAARQQQSDLLGRVEAAESEIHRLNAIIHTPESDDFLKGIATEAEYQRQLHGIDATEARFDWVQYFWVTGYLLNKALAACKSGEDNGEKAKHHLTTTAALISNWHNVLTGKPAACVHSNSGKPVADLLTAQADA